MLDDFLDTIVARATPLGSGGICVLRLSGPEAPLVADRLFVPDAGRGLRDRAPRVMVSGTFVVDQNPIDHGLAVWFRAPRSYTGQDVVELHIHGNMVIAETLLEACVREGARPASAGEFTRRAFLSGRMDLTEVESLAELLSAESRSALSAAERGLRGGMRERFALLRERLLSVLGLLELELDFVEEGMTFVSEESLRSVVSDVREVVEGLLSEFDRGELLRRHARVLLLGRPNVGKSSLFNAILGFDRALVSVTAGTTRDYLEEAVIADGIRFSVIDTAGIRDSDEGLELEGISRALELASHVDLLLLVVDGGGDGLAERLVDVQGVIDRFEGVPVVLVISKVDDGACGEEIRGLCGALPVPFVICSIKRPDSIRSLVSFVGARLSASRSECSVLVTTRQKGLLSHMRSIVDGVLLLDFGQTELISAELRRLFDPLSELSGRTVSNDVLDEVFSAFCIGK